MFDDLDLRVSYFVYIILKAKKKKKKKKKKQKQNLDKRELNHLKSEKMNGNNYQSICIGSCPNCSSPGVIPTRASTRNKSARSVEKCGERGHMSGFDSAQPALFSSLPSKTCATLRGSVVVQIVVEYFKI